MSSPIFKIGLQNESSTWTSGGPAAPAGPQWESALDEDDRLRASGHLGLISGLSDWVTRIVESIELRDDRTIRRSVSFDFQFQALPDEFIEAIDGWLPIPLTLLEKRTLVDFDLRDRNQASIPLLTKAENTDLTTHVLIYWAEKALGYGLTGLQGPANLEIDGEDPYANLRHDLRQIVALPMEQSKVLLDEWEHADPAQGALAFARHKLWHDKTFKSICDQFVGHFVMFIDYAAHKGGRHLVKMAYDESLGEPQELSAERQSWLAKQVEQVKASQDSFGWRFRFVGLFMPEASLCGSMHIEVRAPADLAIERARLIFVKKDDPERAGPDADHVTEGQNTGDIASIYVSGATQDDGKAELHLFIRPTRTGLPRSAFYLSLGVSVLLATFMFLQFCGKQMIDDTQSAATVLLVLPSLFAAITIRPGEHKLASQMVAGIRFFVATAVSLSIVGSIFLIVGVPTKDGSSYDPLPMAQWLWFGIFALSVIVTLMLFPPTYKPLSGTDAESDSRFNQRLADFFE